jgi:vancomycin resistance protein YoaR
MRRYRARRTAGVVATLLLTLALAATGALALTHFPSSPSTPEETAGELRATILSRPHTFVDGETMLVLRAAQLRPLVSVVDARVVVDIAGLRDVLAPAFPPHEARSAELRTSASDAWVVPARPGRELDPYATAATIVSAPRSTTHAVEFRPIAPEVTTAELEALRVTEVVSEFTTHYPAGQPRVVNIRRAAELLDGTMLGPGETFSMNDALGERTTAKGFVAAPMISGGRLVDSVGGGISQVATTLYNAAFFAGLDLVAHTPHSFYIDRYPMGREATISWGGPELIFRNEWDASLLMRLTATETSITVRFYSSKLGRRVETSTGEPYAYRAPVTREVPDATLAPGERVLVEEAGAAGFTVDYTRVVLQNERVIRDETFRARYEPHNAVVLVGVASVHNR